MARKPDSYSRMTESELREEFRNRELKVPDRFATMKPENRRAAMRLVLREDDASKTKSARRRWAPALIGVLLVWAVVATILWILWPRDGEEVLIPAPTQIARENAPAPEAVIAEAINSLALNVRDLSERVSALEVAVAPEPEPTEESELAESQVAAPSELDRNTQGSWEVTFFDGVTDQMRGWFSRLRDPDPAQWPRFPNVDNPAAGFVAADGLEYGLDESVFMQQNEMGNFPVQAEGYRLITGDYNIPGIDSCEAESVEAGCAIAIFNVGEVTADFEAWVRQGFTVPGRYWNGDTLELAMWGLSSHVSANMLNFPTFGAGEDTLNQPDRTNAGANCSVVDGCENVRFVIVITSGNQLLVKTETLVSR